MKAAELRDLGPDELGVKERDLTDQLFRMRIQQSMGQLEAPDKIRMVRRDLAQLRSGNGTRGARLREDNFVRAWKEGSGDFVDGFIA